VTKAVNEEARTEKPTARREREARRKGAVSRSRILGRALLLAAASLYLWVYGPGLGRDLGEQVRIGLSRAFQPRTDPLAVASSVAGTLSGFLLAPLLAAAGIVLLAAFLQVGPRFSPGLGPAPDPTPGAAGRLLFFVFRGLTLIAALLAAGPDLLRALLRTPLQDARDGIAIAGRGFVYLAAWFALFEALVGGIELLYLRRRFSQSLRMTRREIMEEEREEEGDPAVRRARRTRGRELAAPL